MSYGWLPHLSRIVRDESWFGIPLRQDPPLPTRWEEFTFVRDVLDSVEPGRVLDAACGFEPGVHIMPEIAARLGWDVEALDLNPPMTSGAFGVGFPEDPRISRVIGDMTSTSYADASFDAYLSVSVLEHLTSLDAIRSIAEAYRVLRPGGLFILTMDNMEPDQITYTFAPLFDFGSEVLLEGDPLTPEVSFVTGVKR